MNLPLHKVLAVGSYIRVTVDADKRDLFSDCRSHDLAGEVWQIDDEHVWVTSLQPGQAGVYTAGPFRYSWSDIVVTILGGINESKAKQS